jgi:Lon protease-like protein
MTVKKQELTHGLLTGPFETPFEELPESLPVFPLPGGMLLPHGRIPLNFYEPRYLSMVLDSLKQGRFIGMVQPLEVLPDPLPTTSKLFHIGCVGRIIAFAECEDGRIVITLQGICRFKIERELLVDKPYREIQPDFREFMQDTTLDNPGINRNALMNNLRKYLALKGVDVDWEGLEKIEDRPLVAMLGMMNTFDYVEKQAILEAHNLSNMVDVMNSLMEMELASGGDAKTKH